MREVDSGSAVRPGTVDREASKARVEAEEDDWAEADTLGGLPAEQSATVVDAAPRQRPDGGKTERKRAEVGRKYSDEKVSGDRGGGGAAQRAGGEGGVHNPRGAAAARLQVSGWSSCAGCWL
jgi:hypothetical protein